LKKYANHARASLNSSFFFLLLSSTLTSKKHARVSNEHDVDRAPRLKSSHQYLSIEKEKTHESGEEEEEEKK